MDPSDLPTEADAIDKQLVIQEQHSLCCDAASRSDGNG